MAAAEAIAQSSQENSHHGGFGRALQQEAMRFIFEIQKPDDDADQNQTAREPFQSLHCRILSIITDEPIIPRSDSANPDQETVPISLDLQRLGRNY
jgi:hypothetical protein